MPISIMLDIPCHPTSLAEAARIVASLQALYPVPRDYDEPPDIGTGVPNEPETPGSGPSAAAATGDPADFVYRWLSHLGEGSRKFWKLAARYSTDHATLTFEDLEREYGIGKETLRSHHRNSYRAINDEKAPDPMPGAWDQQALRNVYSMTPAVRDKINELTRNDPE